MVILTESSLYFVVMSSTILMVPNIIFIMIFIIANRFSISKASRISNYGSHGNPGGDLLVSNCTAEMNKIKASHGNIQNTYIPTCHANGSYTPVQCYRTSGGGYCWCATSDGKPIPGTSVPNSTPDCSEVKYSNCK